MKVKPNPALLWPLDYEAGVLAIAESEGCQLEAYQCSAGRWTCGWGETDGVGPTTSWTQYFSDQRFCDSLGERVSAVREACTVEPTKYQLCALVSLAYNIGLGGFKRSTVLRCHNRKDFLAASRAFGLWNQYTDPTTGKLRESNGLTARRALESALYLRLTDGARVIPQEVAPQSSIVSSPINAGGAVAAGTGAISMIAQTGDSIKVVGSTVGSAKVFLVETLGLSTDMLIPIVLIGAGVVVMWQRNKQRSGGWS